MNGIHICVVVLVAATCTACLGSSSARPPTTVSEGALGTVSGLVVIDGGKTVADNGGVAELRAVKFARVVVTGRTVAGARLVRRSTTDDRGRFRFLLPPGRYDAVARIFPSAPVQPHTRIVVADGHVVPIRVTGHVL